MHIFPQQFNHNVYPVHHKISDTLLRVYRLIFRRSD